MFASGISPRSCVFKSLVLNLHYGEVVGPLRGVTKWVLGHLGCRVVGFCSLSLFQGFTILPGPALNSQSFSVNLCHHFWVLGLQAYATHPLACALSLCLCPFASLLNPSHEVNRSPWCTLTMRNCIATGNGVNQWWIGPPKLGAKTNLLSLYVAYLRYLISNGKLTDTIPLQSFFIAASSTLTAHA
jgi:hypothetical protein